MTYRRFAWLEMGWGGAAVVLASMGLAGCTGGGGGGGCPEISGSWSVQSTCEGAPTSCEIEQDGCKIELDCAGRTLEGTVSKSSVSFKDDDISCSGKLDDLEDEEEDGIIYPTLEADCELAGDMCEVNASCFQGDCTVPEDEDDDNGGDGDGDGDSGQGGASGVFGMSGVGGASGIGGQGGFSGQGPAGEGGFSGIGGEGGSGAGGFSGEGGSGAGGVGGDSGFGGFGGGPAGEIDADACGNCVSSECSGYLASCTTANGCAPALSCTISSGCSQENADCVLSACQHLSSGITQEGSDAGGAVSQCMVDFCIEDCFANTVPISGAGGEAGGPAPQPCDTCEWALDDFCDEPNLCPSGTDCTDCGGAGQ